MRRISKWIGLSGIVIAVLSTSLYVIDVSAEREGRLRKWLQSKREKPVEVPAGLQQKSIQVGGHNRTYYLALPSSYPNDTPMPVVLVFHGGRANGVRMAQVTRMHKKGEEEGFIVVYPEAIDTDRVWDDGRRTVKSEIDDVAFVSRLLEHLDTSLNIDRRRIYATGASNGGMFTLRLACEMSDRIAAFAPVVANMPADIMLRCQPGQPVPLMFIHGTEDVMMPFGGGTVAGSRLLKRGKGEVISATDSLEFWRQHNVCQGRAIRSALPDRNPSDGTQAESVRNANCRHGSEVIQIVVDGGGHTWPGSPVKPSIRKAGKTSKDFDATDEIWRFFHKHAHPATAS